MSFGAMLTDAQGVPFYIDGTRPLTLINKVTYTVPAGGGLGSIDLYQNDGVMRFVFLQDNGPATGTGCSWLQLDNGVWRLYVNGTSGTLTTAYIFGYANQPVPEWGIALFDAQNNCILTNESKVLKDIQVFGDQSNNNTSGYLYSGTINGSWAVSPYFSGIFSGVVNAGGQLRPVSAFYYLAAHYNGTQTVLKSGIGQGGSPDGTVQSPSYVNSRCLLTAINVAGY